MRRGFLLMKFIRIYIALCVLFIIGAALGCRTTENSAGKTDAKRERGKTTSLAKDVHSYANPEAVKVTNVDLDWDILFDEKIIKGTAELSFKRNKKRKDAPLTLDTRDLKITKVETSSNGGKTYKETEFKLSDADEFLGSPLTIELTPDSDKVRVFYSSSPKASGLQWLTPEQTAGKKTSFMFSQAQAIHARSFIPLQDSPQVRITYTAKVRTPKGMLAVMSAEGNSQGKERDGEYKFEMTKAIPPYLIAIGVGDLQFRPLGKRTGVYAEPSVIEKAAKEFEDTEKMMEETEKIYGDYVWGRYDLLVLPPSFPFGGMENPLLTFATPTILAGDKSLVSLVAHELAHSWSGNLVSNSTWRDFWLNEGFTTYLTYRITEAVYGEKQKEMEAILGIEKLESKLDVMDERDQILHVDLTDRDPDDGFTTVPYEKGALFLRYLEEEFGRNKFDDFLKAYFEKYAFQSIQTDTFVDYLKTNLIDKNPGVIEEEEIEEWIYEAGLPENVPQPKSDAFDKVSAQSKGWLEGKIKTEDIEAKDWSTQEWLHFLQSLNKLDAGKMTELDRVFKFTKSVNSEIAFQWLILSIENKYSTANKRLEDFLTSVGRRKFVKPLFEELAKTPEGKKRAKEIYKKARAGYHPITASSVDKVLGLKE